MSEDLIVRSGIPEIDRCPVLTRVRAFLCQLGVRSTLEHQFAGRDGIRLDLTSLVPGESESEPGESDTVDESAFGGSVVVRFMEALGSSPAGCANPIYEVDGTAYDAAEGLVRVTVPAEIVAQSGIYEAHWGLKDIDGNTVLVNRSLISVEFSLFGEQPFVGQTTQGPPTVQEIRMHVADGATENTLLQDVEFGDEQLLDAVLKPIRMWNESLPPLKSKMTTRNFPYRQQWLDAIVAQLFITAAHNYRRNAMQIRTGANLVDDKNKEQQYLQIGMSMMQSYKDFVLNMKTSLNLRGFFGHYGSSYN